MLDTSARNQTLAGARIVTSDGVVEGALDLQDGCIAAIRPAQHPPGALDLAGDFLIPVSSMYTPTMSRRMSFRVRACSGIS